jgi:hypothetical protein
VVSAEGYFRHLPAKPVTGDIYSSISDYRNIHEEQYNLWTEDAVKSAANSVPCDEKKW